MKRNQAIKTLCLLATICCAVTGTSGVFAAKKAPGAPLTEAGKKLEAQYARQLQNLKAEVTKALPAVNEAKKTAFLKARDAEVAAAAGVTAAQKRMGEINTAKALVGHAKGKWIGGADRGIAAAKAALKKATTDAERDAANKDLAHWQQNRKDGEQALRERQANLDKAEKNRPQVEKAMKDSENALGQAKAATVKAVKDLGLQSLLSSNKLDAKLAKVALLLEATPRGLASFAQQGEAQRELIDKMLSADKLLVQMAVADGATDGNYGRAMQIYSDIWKASDKVRQDPLRRLALAVSLEHATPIKQRNAVGKKDAPATVDPVKRYLHFEQAFLDGELDPAFKNLSMWDYRMVVNGEEPDEILAWGREMLRNYRPDHVTTNDYRWRYVALVRSDIRYGSQDNKCDRDDLQFFQNILMNGGICGRRAFIGRFMLRAFGIPTTARPQRGHAALAHWTPEGWVVCLGGGWGAGYTKTRYDKDLDFLANTQARMAGEPFMQVKRAQWIGDVVGEPRVFGLLSRGKPGFWYGASLYIQKGIIADAKTKTLAAVGEDIGEANVTREKVEIAKVTMAKEDREVTIDKEGVITIPAAATSKPTKSTGKIIFMNSPLGGKQLHYSRNGGAQTFEYTFDAPAAGNYSLTARVVTPSWKQSLVLDVDGAKPVEIALPHTVGLWDETEPVLITLAKGKNVLRFSHKSDGYAKGFSIKNFTLKPASRQVSLVP